MDPLFKKISVIKVSLEATKGTKVAGTSAITVYDMSNVKDTSPYEERNGTGVSRGNSCKGSHGQRSGELTFKMDLRGNGSGGLDAGQAIILQACGLKKTLEVYQVHASHPDDKTISVDVWLGGKKKGLAGAMGNIVFDGVVGDSLVATVTLTGIYQAPVDEAVPSQTPGTEAPFKLKSGSFGLGGESILINKYSLDLGNNVVLRPDASTSSGILSAAIPINNAVISLDPEEALVADYDFDGIKLAGTEAAVSLVVSNGTDKLTLSTPKVETKELSPAEREGISIYDFTGKCNDDSGNDAVVLTASAA
ncbi:MAG: hypothetical protein JXA04_01330 [Gammaproteobacteria bacterium]|nr:hypothetical protein [Gammaproteobacteria bacterium]